MRKKRIEKEKVRCADRYVAGAPLLCLGKMCTHKGCCGMKTWHLFMLCMVEGRAPVARHASKAVRARHVAAWSAVYAVLDMPWFGKCEPCHALFRMSVGCGKTVSYLFGWGGWLF